MLCDHQLTLDEGMKRIMEMFRNGFTKCQTYYLDPRRPVLEQILYLQP
jgi:regulator of replication initiation timing